MRKSKTISAMFLLGKRLLPILAGAVFLSLTGCWDREEVNGLAIVTSAGFDRAEDGTIELTLEIAAPQQGESGKPPSGDQKQKNGKTIIRTATGKTAADAQGRLQMMLPRTIYWGQLQVMVVGETLARDGLREQLDYLVRDNEIRLRVMPFVTRGKVRDFFESPYLLEQTKADFLQSEAARVFHKPLTISQLVQRFSGDQNGAILPFIDVPQEGGGNGGDPYIKGFAVLNQGRMVGTMTGDSFLAAKWVMNQLKNDVQTVNVGSGSPSRVTLVITASNSRLIPSRKEGEWQMEIRIGSELSMIQNTTRLPMAAPQHARKLETAMAEHMRERVEQTVKEAQRMRTDIFGFGEAINRRNPREWKKLAPRWDRFFPQMAVKVEVETDLRRIGMNSIPVGMTQQEEKKQ
ncbi:Ger(x)C family spore germination protein [Paenibacillus macerans]|uniref:Ger(x)C family spore germination protein n=1 Tax=Paenibacillus macerans TaxID=44252 RepID=UPI00203E8E9F|nr:Ger(x)C family spore germination protein [Paenibacillus macerans]MCM3703034.1 Ger(x)C family spore germination protein [Paenibacillus macerans]